MILSVKIKFFQNMISH